MKESHRDRRSKNEKKNAGLWIELFPPTGADYLHQTCMLFRTPETACNFLIFRDFIRSFKSSRLGSEEEIAFPVWTWPCFPRKLVKILLKKVVRLFTVIAAISLLGVRAHIVP